MKTGLLKRGFLGVACALALLVSLPFTALADDGPQPAGEGAKYAFTLTGYEYGRSVNAIDGEYSVTGGVIAESKVYESYDNVAGVSNLATGTFKAGQPYYLSLKFGISPTEGASGANEDVALTFNGSPCEVKEVARDPAGGNLIAVFELPPLDATPFPIPFTKEFVSTSGVAPAEGSFELEVLNSDFVPLGSDFTVKGLSFTTEGSHSFTIENNNFDEITGLLTSGIYVSEKNLGADGWTCDDAVWRVSFRGENEPATADLVEESPDEVSVVARALKFEKGRMVDGAFAPESQPEKMVFVNTYDPVISLTLPFVKKVVQGGALAPGKETFELEIFGIGNSGKDGYADVAYAAAVETNGEGDFEGELTITGPASQVDSFVCEGFFVREAKGAAENWTYSDAVWFVSREWVEPGEVAFTPTLGDAAGNGGPGAEAEPQMALVVYPTTCEADEQGEKRYVPAEESVDKMVFENVYTAAEPAVLAQTGDGANAGLLAALLLASGLGAAGAARGARRLAERA